MTPLAMVHFCEGCNFEGASFGDTVNGARLYFCGYRNGVPECVNKGETNGK